MPIPETAGIPQGISESEGGFDFSSIEESNFADEVIAQEAAPAETESESLTNEDQETDNETGEAPEPSKAWKGLTPAEQSIKDKYYSLLDQHNALQNKVLQLEQSKPVAQIQPQEDDDIETAIKNQWGEDPALLKLARGYKELQQTVQQKSELEVRKTAQTVKETIEDFVFNNKPTLDNPEIGDKFVEEMNDRLPNGDFGAVIKAARAGQKFDPEFAEMIKQKMERAYAVATGKGLVNVDRQKKSNQRVESRSAKPVGVQPETVQTTVQKPMTYKEALKAATGRG